MMTEQAHKESEKQPKHYSQNEYFGLREMLYKDGEQGGCQANATYMASQDQTTILAIHNIDFRKVMSKYMIGKLMKQLDVNSQQLDLAKYRDPMSAESPSLILNQSGNFGGILVKDYFDSPIRNKGNSVMLKREDFNEMKNKNQLIKHTKTV